MRAHIVEQPRPLLARHVEALAARNAALERENEAAFCPERAREMARLAPVLEAHAAIRAQETDASQLRELEADASAEEELEEEELEEEPSAPPAPATSAKSSSEAMESKTSPRNPSNTAVRPSSRKLPT